MMHWLVGGIQKMRKAILYTGILLLPAMFMLAAVALGVSAKATDAGAAYSYLGVIGEGKCWIKYTPDPTLGEVDHGPYTLGAGTQEGAKYGTNSCDDIGTIIYNECPQKIGTEFGSFRCVGVGKLNALCGSTFEAICG